MMSLNDLPVEILEIIFESLALEDLASLFQVSTRMNTMQKTDRIWYSGLIKSHPRLAQRICHAELLRMKKLYGSWRTTARARAVTARELVKALDKMADEYHTIAGLPDLAMEHLRALMWRHGPLFIRDALLDVIHPRRGNPDDNLARVHYARMLYREVQRDSVLLPMFRRFAALPPHRVAIKEAADLLGQWMWPETPRPVSHISLLDYYHQIAPLVLLKIRDHHPLHPITSWKEPRRQPFPDSSAAGWTDKEALQLLDVMNDVLYGQLRLMEDEEPQNPEDAALHRKMVSVHSALSCRNPSMCRVMACLYVDVAGMLGICLHMLQLDTGLLVRWYSSDGRRCLLVDPNESGRRFTKEEACQRLQLRQDQLDTSPEPKLLQRLIKKEGRDMTLNKIHGSADISAVQLLSILADADFQPTERVTLEILTLLMHCRPMYVRRHIEDRINHSGDQMADDEYRTMTCCLDALGDISLRQEHITLRRTSKVRRRSKRATLAQHRFCMGDLVVVPAGELAVVRKRYPSNKVRKARGGVKLPESGSIQRTYSLMIDGCKYMDMREDQLKLAENPRPITHPELGRYFLRFSGGRYVPLPSLEQRSGASLSARGQAGSITSSLQQDCGGSQEDRPAGASSGVETSGVMKPLPRKVPDSWVGTWPEIPPEEFVDEE